jgi:hypothetical protein
MSAASAASLTPALLVSKANAHSARGSGQSIPEHISISPGDNVLRQRGAARTGRDTFAPQIEPIEAHGKRISVGLDERQRLRMRLTSARLGKSQQAILREALEHYLKEVAPGLLGNPCPCLTKGLASDSDCERAAKC